MQAERCKHLRWELLAEDALVLGKGDAKYRANVHWCECGATRIRHADGSESPWLERRIGDVCPTCPLFGGDPRSYVS